MNNQKPIIWNPMTWEDMEHYRKILIDIKEEIELNPEREQELDDLTEAILYNIVFSNIPVYRTLKEIEVPRQSESGMRRVLISVPTLIKPKKNYAEEHPICFNCENNGCIIELEHAFSTHWKCNKCDMWYFNYGHKRK